MLLLRDNITDIGLSLKRDTEEGCFEDFPGR